jgi:hypothetical protein
VAKTALNEAVSRQKNRKSFRSLNWVIALRMRLSTFCTLIPFVRFRTAVSRGSAPSTSILQAGSRCR